VRAEVVGEASSGQERRLVLARRFRVGRHDDFSILLEEDDGKRLYTVSRRDVAPLPAELSPRVPIAYERRNAPPVVLRRARVPDAPE
jgi:hypothetical protein